MSQSPKTDQNKIYGTKYHLVMLTCSLITAFVLGELVVRLNGHFDVDGNFFVREFQCYPYRLPQRSIKTNIESYLAAKDSVLNYHPVLGWVPKSKSKSRDGLFYYNEDGIRTKSCESVIFKIPGQGVLRIALLGDSFTHGDEVSFNDTWGHLLEDGLNKRGINAEVVNFGLFGYGMDQSFLRWRESAIAYDPQIVIFGLVLENIYRNVNLIRPIYALGTAIPFSKPRFIFAPDGLKLINSPTPSLDKIVDIVNHFDDWEYSKYEYWYDKEEYRDRVFFHSKLIAFIYTRIKRPQRKNQQEHLADPESLGFAIINKLKEEVESRGKIFLVVFLPNSMTDLISPDIHLLKNVRNEMALIDPRFALLEATQRLGVQAVIPSHYSAKGSEIVASSITNFLIKQKELSERFFNVFR